MSRHETVREPWLSFLKELDELATSTVRLDCIGGFVVTMLYGLSRTTGALDVLEIAPKSAAHAFADVATEGGKLHQKYNVCLHQVGVVQPPYEYESRLREMFRLSASAPHGARSIRPCAHQTRPAISNEIAVMCVIWLAPYPST